jgi:hypothetical protein
MGANTRYKDSLFSFLFSDPAALRELYGAIKGIELPPGIPITLNTLEGILYKSLLNDISFEVGNKLVVLIEHQSTINPNMAVRLLLYIARVYEKITSGRNMYGSRKLLIPRPECIVLYNGRAPYPEKAAMKLSDSFEEGGFPGVAEGGVPGLELAVKVYNINQGYNEGMIRRCERLRGYSAFIGKARELEGRGGMRGEAVEGAIRWCIEQGILRGFFEAHGSEVVNMLMTEWKLEDALVVEREEGLEEGRERGLEEGRREIAKAALAKGMPPETVSEITGLGLETVKKLAGR